MTAAQKNTQPKRDPYVIKAEKREERYARGWYVIGHTSSVGIKPRALNVFGTKLVAYRGKDDGEVHILDAYCPHMGGDLCGGEVKGNSVICPFHLWSWGADGVCDDIPYANKIPQKGRDQVLADPGEKRSDLRMAGPRGQSPHPGAGTEATGRLVL